MHIKMTDKKMENEVVEDVVNEAATGDHTVETEAEDVVSSEVKDEPSVEDQDVTTEEGLGDEESETASEEKEGSKLFKKKKKVDKKKDVMQEKVDELEDRVKRQMAEFENFRRRSEKEKAQMFEIGAKSIIEKVLPVIDNFERGLSTISEEEANLPFAEGMNKIYKQMMTELENIGVKPIEALGTEFNPDFHNAVMQVETEEFEEGMVAQELMKGYTYRESVVRHSMVGVAQ